MKKSLSICAFSIIMLLGASMDAHSQTRRDRLRDDARARNGYYDNDRGTRGRPTTAPNRSGDRRRVDRNRPNRPNRHTSNRHDRSYDRRHDNRRYDRRHTPSRAYSPYRHNPHRHNYVARRRYLRSVNYARHLRNNRYNYFYRNWIFYPSTYGNGYRIINDYPYFVFNGYQHRYSNYDYCDYQLVDRYTDSVERYFSNRICSYGYDECARERNRLNNYSYEDRYFCAEAYQY